MGPKLKRTKPVSPDAKTAVLPTIKPKPVDPEAKTERIIITPPPGPAPKLK